MSPSIGLSLNDGESTLSVFLRNKCIVCNIVVNEKMFIYHFPIYFHMLYLTHVGALVLARGHSFNNNYLKSTTSGDVCTVRIESM